MNTCKPISTISFNTESFLQQKLNELVDGKIISFYIYIKHYGEPNENRDTLKDHFHVYVEPNKRIDTMQLGEKFNEVDINNVKPLGVLPFQYSKFDDWYLYGLHDTFYLAKKRMKREYHYNMNDMVTNNEEYLKERVNSIDAYAMNNYFEIKDYQDEGYDFEQFVIIKNVHPMQIRAYRDAWLVVSDVNRKSTTQKEKSTVINEEQCLIKKEYKKINPRN